MATVCYSLGCYRNTLLPKEMGSYQREGRCGLSLLPQRGLPLPFFFKPQEVAGWQGRRLTSTLRCLQNCEHFTICCHYYSGVVRATGQRTATEAKMVVPHFSFTALGSQKEDRAAPSRSGMGLWARVLLWHLQEGQGGDEQGWARG